MAIRLGGLAPKISVAVLEDQKTLNTVAQTLTADTWNKRDLNTEVVDPDSIVALSSSAFTLVSGTYLIWAMAPGYANDGQKLRLQNTSDATTAIEGSVTKAAAADASAIICTLSGQFTIAASKTFELQHYPDVTGNGGVALNAGDHETYSQVILLKIA